MLKIQSHLSINLMALALLAACGSPVQSGHDLGDPAPISNAPTPVVIAESKAMKLTIRPLKSSIEFGEPAYLAIEIQNTSKSRYSITGNLSLGDEDVAVFIEGPEKKRRRLAPYSQGDSERVQNIAPGQVVGNVVPIFFGADGWVLQRPGEYGISAELLASGDGYSRFRSETVKLTVNPSSAGDALFKTDPKILHEAGKFLLWRSGDHLASGQQHLGTIAKDYPRTALASHIQASFLRSASEPFADYTKNEVRPANCKRVISLRRTINQSDLPRNIVIGNEIARARCLTEANRIDEATAVLNRALETAGNRPAFSNYVRALNQFKDNLSRVQKPDLQ